MYDIYFDLGNMHQVVEEDEIDLDDEFWQIGETIEFDFVEDEGVSRQSTDDYPVVVKRSKNGYTCKACGEHYPYAEESNQKDGSFKCWSCRNF